MAPIFIPPQPVPVIRQRIRNLADIQDQLRAYDKQQQAIINANDVRFDANNIGRTKVMYPQPSVFRPLFDDEPETKAEPETKEDPLPPVPESPPVQEPEPTQPPRRRRPRSRASTPRVGVSSRKAKTLVTLRQEILATGFSGKGISKAKRPVLEGLAKNLGIDIMRPGVVEPMAQ